MPLDLDHLLAPDGAIARRLERFEPRPQQAAMVERVARAMADRGRLLVEAGTGVGKSFAYLLPAIQRIVDHDERVVVATHTINLQEQLVDKDLPLLNAAIPEEFSAVLVKGRGNYVSLRRLRRASERQDRLLADDDARHALHVIEDWAYSTRDGTLSTLPPLARPEVWDHAQSDSNNCMGRKCPTYEACFYQAARRRMENGDLLVCNHALFFADLALRGQGAGFLPPYDHVVLDEAHTVEDVASKHFGLDLADGRVHHLLNTLRHQRTGRGFLETLALKDGSTGLIDRAVELVETCRGAAAALFDGLWRWLETRGPRNGRVSEPDIVPDALSPALRGLVDVLKILRQRAAAEADEYELGSYVSRAGELAQAAEALVGQQVADCVYWLETSERALKGGASARRLAFRCAPIEVGPILRERLFGQDVSVVMTSATLATAPDDFSHARRRLGCGDADALQLGSPFHYADQMVVKVDETMPDPQESGYVEALWPRVLQHVEATDGGAFVLFTSFAMLDAVADRLRAPLEARGMPMLVHGRDGPPGLLLRRFRHDERTVLLGTVSFWQGVDVRGRGLRNVIITRLPFDVPDRPLVEARLERIRDRGGHPFFDEQVPNAVIRFKQGIGRLIRSAEDEGQIVVLDPRIVRKRYGRAFLDALPAGVPVRRVAPDPVEPPLPEAWDEWIR